MNNRVNFYDAIGWKIDHTPKTYWCLTSATGFLWEYMIKSFWSVLHCYDDCSQKSWWCHDFSSEDRLFCYGRKDRRSTDCAILVAAVVFERVPNLNFSLFALPIAFYITQTVMIMSLTCQERKRFGVPPYVEKICIPLEKQRDKIKSVLLSIFLDPSQSFDMTSHNVSVIPACKCLFCRWVKVQEGKQNLHDNWSKSSSSSFQQALNAFGGFATVSYG